MTVLCVSYFPKPKIIISFQELSCDGGGAGVPGVAAVLLPPGDQGLPAGDHAALRAPAGLLRRARGGAQDHGRRYVRITFSVFSFVIATTSFQRNATYLNYVIT